MVQTRSEHKIKAIELHVEAKLVQKRNAADQHIPRKQDLQLSRHFPPRTQTTMISRRTPEVPSPSVAGLPSITPTIEPLYLAFLPPALQAISLIHSSSDG